MFSMSRDGMLPFSRSLARVSPVTGTPALPAIVIGLLAAAILVINVGEASLFTALTSVCIVMLYGAYLMVTVPLLYRRLTDGFHGEGFSLGRFGVPVNVAAVVYGAAMLVNIGWPRASVYDPAGGHWYLQWFAPLFVVGALAVGGLAFALTRPVAARVELAKVPA
jgi:amino acid transporter